jgi:adenylyl- and sulfurtransferase ThiI
MTIDFDLGRPPRGARIVVAMSGGVDSSVTAALAARTGAEVIGVTLQLYDHGEAVKRSGSCCAGKTSTMRGKSPTGSESRITCSITKAASAPE